MGSTLTWCPYWEHFEPDALVVKEQDVEQNCNWSLFGCSGRDRVHVWMGKPHQLLCPRFPDLQFIHYLASLLTHSPSGIKLGLLQPGGAEIRTCPMTRGCSKPRPPDCPSEHAEHTFLGLDVLSALLHCLSLPLSPWKQNKMFLINSRALTLLPLYGALIKLPRIAIS